MFQVKTQNRQILPALSVVIPVLNERDTLPETIRCLRANESAGLKTEIIIADCNSGDGTPAWVREQQLILVETNPPLDSKTAALNAGAARAQAPVLLFLDADTLLPPDFGKLILETLEKPGVLGGAFEFSFRYSTFLLRIAGAVNRLRYRIDGKFYGDQGVFVSREAFDKIGGFPPLLLMSVPHFFKRLARLGKTKIIKTPSRTSPRRFLEGGVLKVVLYDLYILLLDSLGINVERYARGYWKYNRERGGQPAAAEKPLT